MFQIQTAPSPSTTYKGHIHLFFLFGKDEQEDLTKNERRVIRQMVVELKKE